MSKQAVTAKTNTPSTTASAKSFFSAERSRESNQDEKTSFFRQTAPQTVHSGGSISGNLTISSPTDPAELEAERIAAEVMRIPEDAVPQSIGSSSPALNRKCAACDDEEKVHRSASGEGPGKAPAIVNQVLSQPGQPLPDSTRSFFEPRLGADLSAVRIHTDSQAARSADAVQAKAYTVGSSIAFADGQYAPQSECGKGLIAHELVHVVQQGGGVYRFDSLEHEQLGDVTGVREIDLGGGVLLSWGQVVALAGDYYGGLDQLRADATTSEGKQRIRAALEAYSSPGAGALYLPPPSDVERGILESQYSLLALQNIPHFLAGGTALETWLTHHSKAVHLAMRAGIANDTGMLNEAMLTEAFGEHFLTDAFSSGHIRTPRAEIDAWYVSVFAPRVFERLLQTLRTRAVDAVYRQIESQLPRLVPEYYVKGKIRNGIDARIQTVFAAAGGRDMAVTWLGRALGGLISGAIHDLEGRRGLTVTSDAHPDPYRAYGDTALEKRPDETAVQRLEAELAVIAASGDLNLAFTIGRQEAGARDKAPRPEALPFTVHFAFNRADLSPTARTAARAAIAYMIYNPSSVVDLTGYTDPIGLPEVNLALGWQRSAAVAEIMLAAGIDPARVRTGSGGEESLVSRNPQGYWRNRRVQFAWATADTGQTSDPVFERANEQLRGQVGPPYAAERYIPRPVSDANPELPDWHWGLLPPEIQAEAAQFIREKVSALAFKGLATPQFDPLQIDGYTVEPRPIAQAIVNQVLTDPIAFLNGVLGEVAGPAP